MSKPLKELLGEIPGSALLNPEVLKEKPQIDPVLAETAEAWKELMMMYTCAMREIQTKFEVLSTEYSVRHQRNPIASITTRLKTQRSILEKLNRYGFEISVDSIRRNLHDVAGIRIICPYIDDIYTVADMLLSQDDIIMVSRKDYIARPKPNGYRSLHLIVKVPIFLTGGKIWVKVEVQLRTIAMDFWASLEHHIKYKREIPDQERVIDELRECADIIHATDERMLHIRRSLEALEDLPDEGQTLAEKLNL